MQRLIACFALLIVLAPTLVFPAAARADSDPIPREHFGQNDIADFSKQIERELAARGAYVALVFRSGRARADLPEGLRYSHGAFWVYTEMPTASGAMHYGYAVYNLYFDPRATRRSYLYQDWPYNFVAGDAVGQVGVVVPSAEMQVRILDVIASDSYHLLHEPRYALYSNPAEMTYQNAPEFLLDVISAGAWQTTDRIQIKVNIAHYFRPERLRLGWWTRWIAPWFDRRLRFEDQQGALIETASYDSIANFLLRYEMASDVFEVEAPYYVPYTRY